MKQCKQVTEELQNSVKERQTCQGRYVKADMEVIRFGKADILDILGVSGGDKGETDPFNVKQLY